MTCNMECETMSMKFGTVTLNSIQQSFTSIYTWLLTFGHLDSYVNYADIPNVDILYVIKKSQSYKSITTNLNRNGCQDAIETVKITVVNTSFPSF